MNTLLIHPRHIYSLVHPLSKAQPRAVASRPLNRRSVADDDYYLLPGQPISHWLSSATS